MSNNLVTVLFQLCSVTIYQYIYMCVPETLKTVHIMSTWMNTWSLKLHRISINIILRYICAPCINVYFHLFSKYSSFIYFIFSVICSSYLTLFRIRHVETVEADAVVEARRSFVELEFGEDWPGLSAGYDNLPADMQVCFLKFYILLFIECFF